MQLWTLALDGASEADAARWRALLDAGEQATADRFVFAADRLAYLGAHALVRRVLADRLACSPDRLRFVGGPLEKPRVRIDDTPAGIHVNLSHTRGMAALAVSTAVDPGVDVESLRRPVDLGLADSVFAPPERRWLADLPPAERATGFVRLWTLKEAYVKATGLGLSQALDAFWFAPDSLRIEFSRDIADDPAAWHFHQTVLDGGFVLAAGWREPAAPPRIVTLTELTPGALLSHTVIPAQAGIQETSPTRP